MKDIAVHYKGRPMTIDSVPVPELCRTCKINMEADEKCLMTRVDQLEEIRMGEMFCCFAYDTSDPSIDNDRKYKEMEEFLEKKYGKKDQ